MRLVNEEVKLAIIVDPNYRVVAGFTDNDVIMNQGFNLLIEKEKGDIRFILLEDGSVQAVYRQKDVALPVGTIDSEQLIQRYKEAQKQQEQQKQEAQQEKEQPEVTIVDPAEQPNVIDPLADIDIDEDDDSVITIDGSEKTDS